MRLAATLIGILALVISSCSIVPKNQVDNRAELAKIKGPEPDSIEKTLKGQAEQAATLGDFKRASQMYRQLVDKYPDNLGYAVSMADCLRRSGDNEPALKIINNVLKKDAKNADALEVKGLTLMNIGEFSEATTTFDQVMNIDGKRWRTLNAIGILFAMKKMNTQSIAYYNEALKASPDNPSILNNLGLALAMDKQYDNAIEVFIHAKHFLSNNSKEIKRIDLNLALVYAISGRLDEAEETAAPHLSKAGLYNNMGFYANLANNKELAKSYLNMALTQNPTYYERAWKNLSAVSGDDASESNSGDSDNAMPHGNLLSNKPFIDTEGSAPVLPVDEKGTKSDIKTVVPAKVTEDEKTTEIVTPIAAPAQKANSSKATTSEDIKDNSIKDITAKDATPLSDSKASTDTKDANGIEKPVMTETIETKTPATATAVPATESSATPTAVTPTPDAATAPATPAVSTTAATTDAAPAATPSVTPANNGSLFDAPTNVKQ